MSNGDKRKNNQRATAARLCVRPAFDYLTSRQQLKQSTATAESVRGIRLVGRHYASIR